MTHIVTIIVAVFASTGFWNFIQSKTRRRTFAEEMLLALGHDKIYYLCKRCLKEGEITHDEYDNLLHLFQPYKALGGNGTAEKLMKEIENLPMVED